MASIHITRRAAFDLDEIDQYSINKWGQQVADDYMQSIELALQTLAQNPDLLRQNSFVSQVFFLYRVRQHYLVCSIFEQDIILLTVKSGNLDLPIRLAELEPTLNQEAEFLYSQVKQFRS